MHCKGGVLAVRLDDDIATVGPGDFANDEQSETQAGISFVRAVAATVQGLEHCRQRLWWKHGARVVHAHQDISVVGCQGDAHFSEMERPKAR